MRPLAFLLRRPPPNPEPEAVAPALPRYQGYLDERSTDHVAGWLRDLDRPEARLAYEIVLPAADGEGETVVLAGRAEADSDILVQVGVGDGRYAFHALFPRRLTEAERDRVFARPAGSTHRLELAPELKTHPLGTPPKRPPGPYQGYIDERSTLHVAGWVRNLADAAERVAFEIVLPAERGERVLHRGTADRPSELLRNLGVGDGAHAFYVLLSPPLAEAERDAVFVRPTGSAHHLELAPALATRFEPISHVALDIVDNCNLRCPFCVYDYANVRTTRFMDEATFASALRLIPYVTDGNFWLSCLHEATLHPRLLDFIARVPAEHRRKLFYTTNLAKRMPQSYFATLAESGMHHLNISVESLDPVIYERMRKGARHRVFAENWDRLLAAFAAGAAPPRLRYNVMAYRSNLREIPALVETLRRDKRAWQVEIRHTYEVAHIPAEFREAEFLAPADWAWLAEQLAGYTADGVLLIPPPDLGTMPSDPGPTPAPDAPLSAPAVAPTEAAIAVPRVAGAIPRPLQIGMDWDGTLRVYGEEPRGPGRPPEHVNYVVTNINHLRDPLGFLLAL